MIINGNQLKNEIKAGLIEELAKIKTRIGLDAILIGENPASISFLKQKQNFAQELGIDFKIYEFTESISRNKLREEINKIAALKTLRGIIIQLPLPQKFNQQYFLDAIPEEKDPDCLSSKSLGKFYSGRPLILPPAVEVFNFLNEKYKFDLKNKKVCIFGFGSLTGKPLTLWLTDKIESLHIINENSKNPKEISKICDIIISGVGQTNLIKKDFVKDKAILIDFGYSVKNGKVSGDFDFEELKDKAELITPMPGGTGPILVAMIFKNLIKLAKLQNND